MRESIGATWIMIVVMLFITLFSAYLAFSINYSKAFKVKDGIISRIEKFNGLKPETFTDIDEYLREIGYTSKGRCDMFVSDQKVKYMGVNIDEPIDNLAIFKDGQTSKTEYNYCIGRVFSYDPIGQMTASYYNVVVFYSLSLPMINDMFNFYISGDTSNIYYPTDKYLGWYD